MHLVDRRELSTQPPQLAQSNHPRWWKLQKNGRKWRLDLLSWIARLLGVENSLNHILRRLVKLIKVVGFLHDFLYIIGGVMHRCLSSWPTSKTKDPESVENERERTPYHNGGHVWRLCLFQNDRVPDLILWQLVFWHHDEKRRVPPCPRVWFLESDYQFLKYCLWVCS